jgi:hypothetical protein
MTKQEKIDILWKMMWLNFQSNFGRIKFRKGLCSIFKEATDFKYLMLSSDIPEITLYGNITYLWWWTPYGRFLPWWKRHWAIWKTIQDIKKQYLS